VRTAGRRVAVTALELLPDLYRYVALYQRRPPVNDHGRYLQQLGEVVELLRPPLRVGAKRSKQTR